MARLLLYKYRELDNWKFVLDILVNSRLHAAPFAQLNDPMEGRLSYFEDDVTRGYRRAVEKSRSQINICSLSNSKTNTLLWSYYARGHTGIAVGVEIRKGRRCEVTYDSDIYVSGDDAQTLDPDLLAIRILSQKQEAWKHEREHRVFSSMSFVPVRISELIFGLSIAKPDEALLRRIARRWHPRIRLTRMSLDMLDKPELLTEVEHET
jgi:hypothetical protein